MYPFRWANVSLGVQVTQFGKPWYSSLLAKSVVLNRFTEGRQIQTYIFVKGAHWKMFNTSQLKRFVLGLLQKEFLHKILEVLLKDCWGQHKMCLGAASLSEQWLRTTGLDHSA